MQNRLKSSEWSADPDNCCIPADGSTLRLVAGESIAQPCFIT
jgi:hypothetical protein